MSESEPREIAMVCGTESEPEDDVRITAGPELKVSNETVGQAGTSGTAMSAERMSSSAAAETMSRIHPVRQAKVSPVSTRGRTVRKHGSGRTVTDFEAAFTSFEADPGTARHVSDTVARAVRLEQATDQSDDLMSCEAAHERTRASNTNSTDL